MGRHHPAHLLGRKRSWHHYRHGHRRRPSVYTKHTITNNSEDEDDEVIEDFINFISHHQAGAAITLQVHA